VLLVNPTLLAQLPAAERARIAPFLRNGNSYSTSGCGGTAAFAQISGPGFARGGAISPYDARGSEISAEITSSAADLVVNLSGRFGIVLNYFTVQNGGLHSHQTQLALLHCETAH
jgi:hypothetical protein